MAHSYKTILKKLIFKLGFGFKKNRIEACLGEEIPLQLDESLFKDNVKRAKKITKKNSFARWYKEDGSEITDSKTTQDDQGNTTTLSNLDAELKELLENFSSGDSASVVYHMRSLVKTIIRQEIKNKQIWNAYIDSTSKSYIVRGENLENPTQVGNVFEILRNGVYKSPYQAKCTAILNKRTPVFPSDKDYQIGATLAFVKLRDTDGFNQNANNFYPGDGNGNYGYYTCPYTGGYHIGWQFLADRTNTNDLNGEVKLKLVYGKPSDERSLSYLYFFGNLTFTSVSSYITLPLEKGNRIRWNLSINKIPNGEAYINSLGGPKEFTNFIGILFVG